MPLEQRRASVVSTPSALRPHAGQSGGAPRVDRGRGREQVSVSRRVPFLCLRSCLSWVATGRSWAQPSAYSAAARNATSSTDVPARPPLVSATGCGPSGTIADQSGFEDADSNLAVDHAGCMDWNGFAPVTWTGSVPYQGSTKTNGGFTFFGASDAIDSHTDTSYSGGVKQADQCPATGPAMSTTRRTSRGSTWLCPLTR